MSFFPKLDHHCMFVGLISAALLSATSCKPSAKSTTKSLDNFTRETGASVSMNQCGIEHKGKKAAPEVASLLGEVKASAELKEVAGEVLTAAPAVLRDFYFKGLKGTVVVSSNASEVCQTVGLSKSEREFGAKEESIPSCWKMNKKTKRPEIHIMDSEIQVRHSLIRLLSYVFTDFMTVRNFDDKNPAFDKKALDAFRGTLTQVGDALIKDLKEAKKEKVLTRLKKFKDADQRRFENFAYAETLDSYYCSKEARDKFEDRFVSTWKVFTSTKDPNSGVAIFGSR